MVASSEKNSLKQSQLVRLSIILGCSGILCYIGEFFYQTYGAFNGAGLLFGLAGFVLGMIAAAQIGQRPSRRTRLRLAKTGIALSIIAFLLNIYGVLFPMM